MDDKLLQVLHKVEQLCEQNVEFATALKESLSVAPTEPNADSGFSSAMRLQHQRCRKKARAYYEKIADDQLRQNLINDHATIK